MSETGTTIASLFDANLHIEVDPAAKNSVDLYSENGVAAEYRALWPAEFATAARVHANDNPQLPRMFGGGKLNYPVATASGIDPKTLSQVPYRVRHAIAAEPSRSHAYEMIEYFADMPYSEIDHVELRAAVARVRAWANIPADQLTEAESTALYERVMAPIHAGTAGRIERQQQYRADDVSVRGFR